MARIGIDATSVAPEGKGISRVQRGTVEALRALGRHELVVFARHPEQLPDVDAIVVSDRPTLLWEQRGLARAVREHRLDAMLTWTERLPCARAARRFVGLALRTAERTGSRRTGACARVRGSSAATS